MPPQTQLEAHGTRLARMRHEIAALEYRLQGCDPEDRLRLNKQLEQRKEGLQMVLKLKD